MRKKWFVIIALFAVGSVFSGGACAFGLKKDAKQQMEVVQRQLNELNDNFKGSQAEIQALRQEIKTLNENLVELKALNPVLKELSGVLTRVADILESINQKAEVLLKYYKFRAPK